MTAKQTQFGFTIADVYEAGGKTLFTANIKAGGKDTRIEDLNPSCLEELLCAALLQTYDQGHPVQLHWYDDDGSVMYEWRIGSQDGYEAINNDPLLITLSLEEGNSMKQLSREAVDLKTLTSTLAAAGTQLASHVGVPDRTRGRLTLLSKALNAP